LFDVIPGLGVKNSPEFQLCIEIMQIEHHFVDIEKKVLKAGETVLCFIG